MAFDTGSFWAERTRMSTPARWRAVDEHGFVLDILLQRHRDTDAARIFLIRLLGEYDVPDTICTDQLRSYGAAIREILNLVNVDHQQVVATARCNNMIKQRASVASGAVLPKTIPPFYTTSRTTAAGIQAAETRARISELARPNHQPPPSHPNQRVSINQKTKSKARVPDVVNGCRRGGLKFRPPLPSAHHDAS